MSATPEEMKKYYQQKHRHRMKHALWEVRCGDEESNRRVGLFASRKDALLVYRATRLTLWLERSETVVLGRGCPGESLSENHTDARGGLTCNVGRGDWVTMEAVLVIPAGLDAAVPEPWER